MSIRTRLFLIVGLALTTIFALGGTILVGKWRVFQEAEHLSRQVTQSIQVGAVVHELQKERGVSALFVNSEGTTFGNELRDQRASVDQVVAAYRDALAKDGQAPAWLEELAGHRRFVDDVENATANAAGAFYTKVVATLLQDMQSLASASDADILRLATAHLALLRGKEMAGQERAIGATTFSSAMVGAASFNQLSRRTGMQRAYFDSFSSLATPETAKQMQALTESATEKNVEALRIRAETSLSVREDIGDGMAQQWFKAATERIDAIKTLEDLSAQDLITLTQATATQARNTFWALAGILLAVMLALGFVAARVVTRFTRTLNTVRDTLIRVGDEGDLALRIEAGSKDEVGQMAAALNGFLDTLQRLLGTLGEIEKTGDLTLRMADFGQTSQVTNAFLQSLESAFREINEAASQVGKSAGQLTMASQILASSTEEQSAVVEEVTASAEETGSQVKANAEAANTANQLVMGASQAATEGQSKMITMTTAMNEINDSAREIAKIIKVIDEIAFQTNLLALNAAVEAARAGQHGRGFAVVAQEVRNLAGRSAKAAKETAELIDKSVRQVEGGVTVANETGEALAQIVGNVLKVKDLVAEIAAASQEQSRGVAQIHIAISQVSNGVQDSSKQAEELSAGSEELSAASDAMLREVQRFKVS